MEFPNPDDLKAVLFLNGPAEMRTFVCDVRQSTTVYLDPFFGLVRYELHQCSLLGPEGWTAQTVNSW